LQVVEQELEQMVVEEVVVDTDVFLAFLLQVLFLL
tara:strand:- start:393 stop:497 length:105 start_codon:yes stop_codon:yes gene_type:complete